MEEPRIELLAPAGSLESGMAAIRAGADALYVGGARFGARAYAESVNSKEQEDPVLSLLRYAHLHGRKVYLTVNTLLKEQELEGELYEYLLPYWQEGLDAVIVQDLGVFSFIKRNFPDLPIHASTQMTITGPDGAGMLEELGAKRVVTARELSLEELKEIRKRTGLEIEAFVHGAICYCYSGQCLLSSLIGARSGNRGRCAQPCRLPYQVESQGKRLSGKDEAYVLNLKDMCTLRSLPRILDAGVYSLKIEGRMKGPLYTAGVTSIYRKYVDLYLEGKKDSWQVDPYDEYVLGQLFDRGGYTEEYLYRHNGRDMIARKEKPAFRAMDPEVAKRLTRDYLESDIKEPVLGQVVLKKGSKAVIELSWKGIQVKASGPVVEEAKSQPMTGEKIAKQLNKTGNALYEFKELSIQADPDIFLPVSALNGLRREGFEALSQAVLKEGKRGRCGEAEVPKDGGKPEEAKGDAIERNDGTPKIHVALLKPELLSQALARKEVSRIYLYAAGVELEMVPKLAQMCRQHSRECYLILPAVFRREARMELEQNFERLENSCLDGYGVCNLDTLAWLRLHKTKKVLEGESSLYVWNREGAAFVRELGISSFTAPAELNERELMQRGMEQTSLVVYGRTPVMISAGCLLNTVAGCTKKPGVLWMRDRKNERFPALNFCKYCYNIIYNAKPVSLLPWVGENGKRGWDQARLLPSALRIDFTLEEESKVQEILERFIRAAKEGAFEPEAFDFTRGHFRRGVE